MFKPAPEEVKGEAPKKNLHLMDRYVDPTGEFTNRELNFAEWYLKHKVLLRRLLTGFLVVLCVGLGGYSLYGITEYGFFGYWQGEVHRANLTKQRVALNAVKNDIAANPLQIDAVSAYPSSPGKADFLAFVQNPNKRWAAKVFYNFAWENGETLENSTWLWPEQKGVLAVFGVKSDVIPGGSRLTIKNIEWYRLDNHEYVDPAAFVSDRLNINVENLVFTPANSALGVSVSQISFSVKNDSPFGYWQVPMVGVFKKGDVIMGGKQFIVESLRPESAQGIELHSLSSDLDLDTVELYPSVDLFDQGNYLPFKQ